MHVPVVDFSRYELDRPATLQTLGREVDPALSKIGFMSVTNLGIDPQLLDDVFSAKWAAIATPLLTSGFAWAAIAAGAIVDRWNVEALAIGTAAGMGVCLLLLIPSRAKIQ